MPWNVFDRHRPDPRPILDWRAAVALVVMALVIVAANLYFLLSVSPVQPPPPPIVIAKTLTPVEAAEHLNAAVERWTRAQKVRADLVRRNDDKVGLWAIEEVLKQVREEITSLRPQADPKHLSVSAMRFLLERP